MHHLLLRGRLGLRLRLFLGVRLRLCLGIRCRVGVRLWLGRRHRPWRLGDAGGVVARRSAHSDCPRCLSLKSSAGRCVCVENVPVVYDYEEYRCGGDGTETRMPCRARFLEIYAQMDDTTVE